MFGFVKQLFIFISISSYRHQQNINTGWKILPGVGKKALPLIDPSAAIS